MQNLTFVGGAGVGLGFLQSLVGHGFQPIVLPGHLSERTTHLIELYAKSKQLKLIKSDQEIPSGIIISAGNHILFDKPVLDRCRVINFHAAPLPEYRGSGAMAFAILNQEQEFGVTFHYATEKLDCGETLHVERFKIDPAWTAGELDNECARVGIEAFDKIAVDLIEGNTTPMPPAEAAKPPYARSQLSESQKIEPDWCQKRKWRHIRAHDWPGILEPAFTHVDGKKVYLLAKSRGDWL